MIGYTLPARLLGVFLLVIGVAGDKHTSQQYQHDNNGQGQPHHYSASYHHPLSRDDRKLIFVNNQAYDLSEEEQTRVWELYLKKGYVPNTQDIDSNLQKNPLMATVMSPVAATLDRQNFAHEGEEASMKAFAAVPDDQLSNRINSHQYPVKSSRFVANPEKVHLIEDVNSVELQDLQYTTATTEAGERVGIEPSVETATVHYEATKVNALTFVWRELWNIGELLGREMYDISSRLWYLLSSLVKYVQARGRRAIPDLSKEL